MEESDLIIWFSSLAGFASIYLWLKLPGVEVSQMNKEGKRIAYYVRENKREMIQK